VQKIQGFFETIRTTFAALDLENPVWATAAAVLVTLIFVLLIGMVRRTARRVVASIENARSEGRIKSFRFQRQDLLDAEDVAMILTGIVRAVTWMLVALLVVLNLNAVFGIFPATRGIATAIVEVIVGTVTAVATEIWSYLPNLVTIIVICLVGRWLIRFAQLIFKGLSTRRITLRGFYPEWANPTFNLVRLVIIVFVVVLVFPILPGAHLPAFRGVSIFVGILLSLGSTAAVANMVAGVVLTYSRAFKVGDRVKIGNTVGDVVERTLFATRVKTPKNVEIAVPNSQVLANHVVNYSSRARREPGLVLHTTVTIGYDVPRSEVRDLLVSAALATEDIEPEPEAFVLVTSLDDFYVSYELNVYTRRARLMPATYSALHANILDRFHEAGVEIMSPHYAAIRDGNRLAMPKGESDVEASVAPFWVRLLGGQRGDGDA